jgi:hypothetical protein
VAANVRIELADRELASRQSASFVPVECGKLGCFLLDNSGELLLAFKRFWVHHLLNLSDLERRLPEALNAINHFHKSELLSQDW